MKNAHHIHRNFRIADFCPKDVVVRDSTFTQLDEADSPNPGSLVYCQNLHYLQIADANPNVSAIICPAALRNEALLPHKGVVLSEDPRRLFFRIYKEFYEQGYSRSEIEPGIGEGCKIHPSAVIGAYVRIGDRVEIGAHVTIEDYCEIGDDVYIGANAVIGAEGLITLRSAEGSLVTVKHGGSVRIGKGSQILAGAVIAKSLFRTPTSIGEHCQIGIMTNIGHGAVIGDESVISGNSVIAGRTKVGKRVWVGTAASVAQGLVIGERAQVKMGAVVINSIKPGEVVSGNFATSHRINMMRLIKGS